MPSDRKSDAGPFVAGIPRVTLRVTEAADALGVSVDWFERHVLPSVRVVRRGRMKLVLVTGLQEWAEENSERLLDGATR